MRRKGRYLVEKQVDVYRTGARSDAPESKWSRRTSAAETQRRFTNMMYQVRPPRILSKGGSVLMRALK
jgi:hypothetical protein